MLWFFHLILSFTIEITNSLFYNTLINLSKQIDEPNKNKSNILKEVMKIRIELRKLHNNKLKNIIEEYLESINENQTDIFVNVSEFIAEFYTAIIKRFYLTVPISHRKFKFCLDESIQMNLKDSSYPSIETVVVEILNQIIIFITM